MTLTESPGVAVPFNELPAEKQGELLQWLRLDRERKLREDPVGYFQLQYPSGEPANHEVHQMHTSLATKKNDDRAILYLLSQKARAEKLAAWEQAVKDAKAEAANSFKFLQERAAEAAAANIIMSDSKQAKELRNYRRAHVVEVQPPIARIPAEPDLSYDDRDALWVQIQHSGIGAIRHD
jgi:hypothetical protein